MKWLLTGLILAALISTAFTCALCADAPPAHGMYINKENPKEYLSLGPDGTFFLKLRKKPVDPENPFTSIQGKYELNGNDLTLKLPDGGEARGKIQGNTFLDSDGKPWQKGSEPFKFDKDLHKPMRW